MTTILYKLDDEYYYGSSVIQVHKANRRLGRFRQSDRCVQFKILPISGKSFHAHLNVPPLKTNGLRKRRFPGV